MYNELKKENIIIDLQVLMNNIETQDENINSYAEFMKERFLSLSGIN